jgi:flagellar biosynthesis protein FlhB
MKMSKQEVKDESKQMDGDVEMKQKMRQAMMEMAKKGMMAEVPTATVVVTNPTYIAIAIRYIRGDDESPMVVAKGKRKIAEQIRTIADDNSIPVMQNIPLARGMYDLVEPGQDIPTEFFTAVAELLALVYKEDAKKY